jgi:hypothetical protein
MVLENTAGEYENINFSILTHHLLTFFLHPGIGHYGLPKS